LQKRVDSLEDAAGDQLRETAQDLIANSALSLALFSADQIVGLRALLPEETTPFLEVLLAGLRLLEDLFFRP
jgi:hypothetical protein